MQRKLASSTSNPINFPDSSFAFHGGYAPSVPIFILSARAVEEIKTKATKEDRKNLHIFFMFPPFKKNNTKMKKKIMPEKINT